VCGWTRKVPGDSETAVAYNRQCRKVATSDHRIPFLHGEPLPQRDPEYAS